MEVFCLSCTPSPLFLQIFYRFVRFLWDFVHIHTDPWPTELQNGRGWKGALEGTCSKPSAQAEPPGAGCPGPRPGGPNKFRSGLRMSNINPIQLFLSQLHAVTRICFPKYTSPSNRTRGLSKNISLQEEYGTSLLQLLPHTFKQTWCQISGSLVKIRKKVKLLTQNFPAKFIFYVSEQQMPLIWFECN